MERNITAKVAENNSLSLEQLHKYRNMDHNKEQNQCSYSV